MRKFLYFIFFFPLICFAQKLEIKTNTDFISIDPKVIYTERNCEKGNEKAKLDFENEVYNFFTYGLTISLNENEKKINEKVHKYLKDKYSINYEHKGCVVFEDEKCYMETMNKLIDNKFGKNYFENKLEEARKKFTSN